MLQLTHLLYFSSTNDRTTFNGFLGVDLTLPNLLGVHTTSVARVFLVLPFYYQLQGVVPRSSCSFDPTVSKPWFLDSTPLLYPLATSTTSTRRLQARCAFCRGRLLSPFTLDKVLTTSRSRWSVARAFCCAESLPRARSRALFVAFRGRFEKIWEEIPLRRPGSVQGVAHAFWRAGSLPRARSLSA